MERIDLDSVIRHRLPDRYDRIPKWLIHRTERFIRQDDLNALMEGAEGKRDADFCRSVLTQLNTSYTIRHPERLPEPEGGRRVIFTCNHPLGALDGIIIIDMLAAIYGKGIKFIVNDLLCAIEPLRGVFLPINKHGNQSRQAVKAIEEALDGSDPVIIFPAGLCSRASFTGKIADLKWNKMFVGQALKHQRDVIPLYFEGRNSASFYIAAKLREMLGIKLNLEMIYLPGEVFRCRDKSFTITAGERIPYTALKGGTDAPATAAALRQLTYTLAKN